MVYNVRAKATFHRFNERTKQERKEIVCWLKELAQFLNKNPKLTNRFSATFYNRDCFSPRGQGIGPKVRRVK